MDWAAVMSHVEREWSEGATELEQAYLLVLSECVLGQLSPGTR
jgi:hypothetical protein